MATRKSPNHLEVTLPRYFLSRVEPDGAVGV